MYRSCTLTLALTCALALLAPAASLAAPATCEARGLLLDTEGNPVAGATLSFRPSGLPDGTPYTAKTNRKGRYFVTGMFHPQGDKWQVTVEAEGYAPVKMEVESRTVNKVLIGGEIWITKLNPGKPIPDITIKPLGAARIDFELSTEDRIAAALATAAAEAAEAQGGGSAATAQNASPWDAALTKASNGDLDGAIPLFREAIEEKPEDVERRETLAKVLYQAGRYDEARTEAQTAVEQAPDNVEVAMVLYSSQVAVGDMAGAKATLETARQHAPDDPRILKQLGYVASETGDRDGAIAAYEALVAGTPDDAQAWVALGDLYAAAGRVEDSRKAYQRVTELDPENAHQVFYNLGALIMNRVNRSDQETQQAIAAFRKAIDLKPDYAQAHKQLALALIGAGDRSGARAQLEAYVELAPDAPDAGQMQLLIKSLQ